MNLKKLLLLFSLLNIVSITFGFSVHKPAWSMVTNSDSESKELGYVLSKYEQVKPNEDEINTLPEKTLINNKNTMDSTNEDSLKKRFDFHEKELLQIQSENQIRNDRIKKLISDNKPMLSKRDVDKDFFIKDRKIGPLNVIMLLVEKLDENKAVIDGNLKTLQSFPIQGVLKNSNHPAETKSEKCNCEDSLRSNVISLLSWAQHIKKMSTGMLYEIVDTTKKMETECQRYLQTRLSGDIEGDLEIRDKKSVRPVMKEERYGNGLLNINDILGKIKDSFSRILLRNIEKNVATKQQRTNEFVMLMIGIFDNLKQMPNSNGHVLVITAGPDDFSEALKLLDIFVQRENTLLIVTGTCPRNDSHVVPFFARGPSSQAILDANIDSLVELPKALRSIINATDCRDSKSNCGRPRVSEEVGDSVAARPTREDTSGRLISGAKHDLHRKRFVKSNGDETALNESEELENHLSKELFEVKITNLNGRSKRSDIPVPMNNSSTIRASMGSQIISSYSTLIVSQIITIVTIHALIF